MEMDDVLKEVRRIREEYAAEFNFDLDAIHQNISEHQRTSGRTYVSLPPRRPELAKTNATQKSIE